MPLPALTLLEVRDVFRTTGIPVLTFVDRQSADFDELRYKLDNRGLVNVHGDSRSGKTVLSLKFLERRNPISSTDRIFKARSGSGGFFRGA